MRQVFFIADSFAHGLIYYCAIEVELQADLFMNSIHRQMSVVDVNPRGRASSAGKADFHT